MHTLDYYNEKAESFVEGTLNVDFSAVQKKFLSLLPEKAYILDFGCGSGRDTKYFLNHGYIVDAIDGSEELCKLASKYTGIAVRQMLFQELDCEEAYDGIWACASVLHLPKAEMPLVFARMVRALKHGGVLYTSFKYGDFEGLRNGRYFSNYDETSIQELLGMVPELQINELWITGDVRPGRSDEQWLNLLLTKK